MKKILLSATALFAVAFGLYADSVTYSASKLNEEETSEDIVKNGRNISEFVNADLEILCTDEGTTGKYFQLYTSNIRIFPGNQMTIRSKEGKNKVITGITFAYDGNIGEENFAELRGNYYVAGSSVANQIEFEAKKTTLSWKMNASDNVSELVILAPQYGQARISDFTITYENAPEISDVELPVISGTTPFSGSTTVSISGSGEVFYTLDGSDPTIESTLYEAPFTLTETTTVKAINVVAGTASNIASMTFVNADATPDTPTILLNGIIPSGDTATYPDGSVVEVSFRNPAEGVDIMYNIDSATPEKYSGPFEVTKTSAITYWAAKGDKESEKTTINVVVEAAPVVVDGVPEGISLIPGAGNVRNTDFKDGLDIIFTGASQLWLNYNEATVKVTGPDNVAFTRMVNTEHIVTDLASAPITPEDFTVPGEYTMEIDVTKCKVLYDGGTEKYFPPFRVKYNVTIETPEPDLTIPEGVVVTPAPGTYDKFPSDVITISFPDCYAVMGADGRENASMKDPSGLNHTYTLNWIADNLNQFTFGIPEVDVEATGKYIITIDMKGISVYADTTGALANIPSFSFAYEISGGVGVEDIDTDEAEAVYYDLNGRRVLEPAHGIFVKIQGEKVSKVLVK